MKSFTFISLLFFVSQLSAQCINDTLNIYSFSYNGQQYEIVKENKTWEDGAACAVERGGYLTEINSLEEQDTIFYNVNNAGIMTPNTVAPDGGGGSYLWIGGNDMDIEGDWMWDGDNTGPAVQFWQGTSSGSPIGGLYNNWGNEPDDFNGQDGLGLGFTNWPLGVAGQWNDVDTSNLLYYIIEYDATGASIEDEGSLDFKIYPNPVASNVSIEMPDSYNWSESLYLSIFDTQGKLVGEYQIQNKVTTISVDDFQKGLYLIKIKEETVGEFVVID